MNLITNNWNLKLMALALAIVLWGHVRSTVNPWETATFLVPLRAIPPSNMVLVNTAKIPDTVKVTVGGPRLNLRQIKGVALANPLSPTGDVTSVTGGQVTAALDFSLARKGRQDVPVKAATTVDDVEVIGVNPTNVEVVLDSATRAQVTVRPQLVPRLAAGLRLENVTVQPASVSVSGPSAALTRVAAAQAVVKQQDLEVNVPRTISAPVVALDARGQTLEDVTIEPRTTKVIATLREERVTRRLRVIAKLRGEPAPGYRITSTEITPRHLTVRGLHRDLKDITSLPVAVDVDGAAATLQRPVAVQLPRGLTRVGRGALSVRVRVAPLEESPRATPDAAATVYPADNAGIPVPENALPVPALPGLP